MTETGTQLVAAWEARGRFHDLDGHRIFAVDVPGPAERDPMLILHGFPSSGFDWRLVVDRFATRRRVIVFDMLGYGLSDKPDQPYRLAEQADLAQGLMAVLGIERVALVTHDMGDTVGGELLARDLDGDLPFDVTARVVTNGSIYIEMAQLTAGQEMLLAIGDERIPPEMHPGADGFKQSLAATFAADHSVPDVELDAWWDLSSRDGGHLLLARLCQYIEERRARQDRYTGAIETHSSPLGIVWGDQDPIAVHDMALRLAAARPDATLVTLEGIGHYPMVEAPELFATAVLAALES